MDCSLPGSSVHVIFQARIWSWLPFPTPRDLPNAGVEPVSLESPALAGRFFTTAPPGKPLFSGPSPYIAKWQVLKNEKLDEVWNATVLCFSNVIEKQCVCEPVRFWLPCVFNSSVKTHRLVHWHSTKQQIPLGLQKVNLLEIPAFSHIGSILLLQSSLAKILALLS